MGKLYRERLRNKDLITLGMAESISGLGSWVTMMAVLALLVFQGGGGVVETSGIFLAGLVPTLVASPVAGWLVDRFDSRVLMIASELLSGAAVSGLMLAHSSTAIYALLALQSLCGSVMMPARQATVPRLVEREQFTRANALLQQLAGMTKIIGPILGGAVLAVLQPRTAILLDVVSYGLGALVLTRLPALAPERRVPGSGEPNGAGRVVLGSPQLRLLFVVIFFGVAAIIGFDTVGAVYSRDVLRGGERFFGLMIGLVGAGTLLATTGLMMARGRGDGWRRLLAGLVALAGLPLLLTVAGRLPGTAAATALALLGCVTGGIGLGLVHVEVSTLVQVLSPPPLRGRVAGMLQGTMVAAQLVGLVLTPMLVPSAQGINAYLAVAAITLVAVALLGAGLLARDRRRTAPVRMEAL
jgi:MFS family permease